MRSSSLLVSLVSTFSVLNEAGFTTTYPSSCRDLPDGSHDLKLLSGDLEDAPVVNVVCSNGYIILDVSRDSNLESYFTSFKKYHHSAAGPTNSDQVNWEGWYRPDDGATSYLISPDCDSCDESSAWQQFGEKTAYMMTGTLFGCFWNLKGEHNFDQDYDTYECYYSSGEVNAVGRAIRHPLDSTSTEADWDASGVCAFSVRSSERTVPEPMRHDACTGDLVSVKTEDAQDIYSDADTYHLKPSLGTSGKFCVCARATRSEYFEVSDEVEKKFRDQETLFSAETFFNVEDDANDVKLENEEQEEQAKQQDEVFKLYQKDFEKGTFRITKSGTYRVMEDILFDFNANYDRPSGAEAWWPTKDQRDDYPGAGGYSDAYFLGFYAGISVECDDVILDLNGKELRMSEVFYHQQRWFTIISLTSQYFLPGQGIGFFGADPHFAENIVIKDGTLGLSSHHGVHGHFNKNVRIENVWVRDFETHGIQLNGFDGITIDNCEIGPTSRRSFFKGEYGHARILLKRFTEAAEAHPDEEFKFYGRDESVTMQDIVDELGKQVDMAYDHVVKGIHFDETDPSWQSAKYLFLDKTNLPNGAAMYGIFLNTYGASVLTYNLYTSFFSKNAVVSNTKIHGLHHSMLEYTRLQYPGSGNLFMNPLHAPFDAEQLLVDIQDLSAPRYKGSILTDACVALERLESDNFDLLQAQLLIDDNLLSWAFAASDDSDSVHDMDNIVLGCNNDAMIHSGKGINALRIDGVENVVIDNLQIFDVSEQTPLGNEACGAYEKFVGTSRGAGGGHFRQTLPMQTGFSGTMLQGVNINAAENVVIKDLSLWDLESLNGPVFGLSVWPATHVRLEGRVEMKRFSAGSGLELGILDYDDRPNRAPEVCAVRVMEAYEKDGETYVAHFEDEVSNYDVGCLNGHVGCLGQAQLGRSMFGSDLGPDACEVDAEQEDVGKKLNDMKKGDHGIVAMARENVSYALIGSFVLCVALVLIAQIQSVRDACRNGCEYGKRLKRGRGDQRVGLIDEQEIRAPLVEGGAAYGTVGSWN